MAKIGINSLQEYNLIQVCNWKNPENVAIEYHSFKHDPVIISYSHIDEAQKTIKQFLANIEPSQFIGISSDVPIFCIPALMLGVIFSGHAFVYLSTDSELLRDSLRVEYVFSRNLVATDGEIVKNFIIHQQALILLRQTTPVINYNEFAADEDANFFAYAVTTSGSTGIPVIVKATHACIVPNIVQLVEIFKLSSCDKIAQLTPLTFDPSIVEIFLSLSCGGTLFAVSEKLRNNPHKLLMSLHGKGVTFISTTPSLLLHRWPWSDLKTTILGKDSKLRVLLLGGELFPTLDVLSRIKHSDNRTRIFNIYGITEVSCWASINQVLPDMTINPEALGSVLNDTIFQVRNEKNSVIHEGEGVLYIGSNTRICEINNEKLCNLKPPVFRNSGDIVTISKAGEINFKGREDSCIKRFGTKIYLNDLKYHLEKLIFIEDSYTICSNQLSTLDIFFTASKPFHNDTDKLIADVWTHVKKLPAILHPDSIHLLNHFKMTQHGKICKDSLKKLCIKKSSDAGILFETIWRNHLSTMTNNDTKLGFLDAGGTSFMALQISSKLTDETKKDFPQLIGMLLENHTLKACQSYISQHSKINSIFTDSLSQSLTCNYELNDCAGSITDDSEKNFCFWQRCRGKTLASPSSLDSEAQINDNSSLNSASYSPYQSVEIRLENKFDLKKCVDASPTVFEYTDDRIFASVGSHSGIICTVELLKNISWKVQLPNRIEGSVLVLDEFRGVVGCHDGFIYCLHLITGEIFWKFQTGNMVKCLAVICSNRKNIFIGSYDRFLYCIILESGTLVWKRKAASIRATPLVHDDSDSVIFSLLDGCCISLDQGTGRIRWKHQLKNAVFSSPAASRKSVAVFVDVFGNFTGLDICRGNKLWDFSVSAHIFSDLVIHRNVYSNLESLIFASKDGNVYRYDYDDTKCPKLRYKIDCSRPIVATPWVNDLFITIAHENGDLAIIDFKTGTSLSHFKLAGECFSSPVVYRDFIVVGCRDNNLCILKLEIEKAKLNCR